MNFIWALITSRKKKKGRKPFKSISAPDVEVVFEFNGTREHPAADGYRPEHLVKDNYATCGVHHYFDVDMVPPDGQAKGTITFITPEMYPACLWVGRKINIQEGEKIVGYATITKIFNPVLDIDSSVAGKGPV